jgi:hypothetical protein
LYQHNKHQTTKYTGNQNSAVTKKGPFCILYNLYLCLIYQLTKKENIRRERNHHLSKERKPIRLNQSCIEKYQIQAKQNPDFLLFFKKKKKAQCVHAKPIKAKLTRPQRKKNHQS